MNTIWDSHSHEDHFAGRNVPFSSSQSDVVLADMNAGRIFVSPMGYAIGQYARWVKPGARRIAATSDNARAIVTAFRDPAARRLIVVVVNTSLAAQTLHVALRGGSVAGAVTGEYSAGTSRWEPIADFPAEPDGSLRYTALARSVTTLAIPLR